MEIWSTPKDLALLIALVLLGSGLLFLLSSKKNQQPSLDVPIISISSAGKTFLGGALLMASLVCFATAIFYPKF